MKNKLIYLATAALFAAGCHSRSDSLKRDQQQYDVVQEGSASGVTSTINAPGEVAPPAMAAPMTGTNADTTSNFNLPQVATSTAAGQPGTLAGTMTAPMMGGMPMAGYPGAAAAPRSSVPASRPRVATTTAAPAPVPEQPRIVIQRSPRPVETTTTQSMTSSSTAGQTEGAPTATSAPAADTQKTDTQAKTDTQPKSGEKPKSDEKPKKDDEPPPPTSTDTQPPPTATTT